MAIDDYVLKRQQADVRRRQADQADRPEELRGVQLIHLFDDPATAQNRYAKMRCGVTQTPRTGTMNEDKVTCPKCRVLLEGTT